MTPLSRKIKDLPLTPIQLHQWIGRAIAILGIVQVALGITLYGSPKWIFIAFAVWAFLLLILYFILSYRNQPDMGFDDRGTYITERTGTTRTSRTSRTSRSRTSRTSRSQSRRSVSHGGLGALAAAGAAGAGLAALRQRSSSRRSGRVLSSRRSSRQSDSYISDEKHSTHGRRQSTWKDKLFGVGAVGGGVFALRSIFNRKKHTTTESGTEVSYSRPTLGPSEVTQTDLSRLEEGRAPTSPANNEWRRVEEREAAQAAAARTGSPSRPAHRPSRSGISIDSSSFDSATNITDDYETTHNESHGLRTGVAALGVAGFLRHQWNKRRNKKEDAHVESLKQQDIEEERIARANSNRRKFTADGSRPPPRRTTGRPPSTIFSESDISRITPAVTRPPPRSETNLTSNVETTIAGPSTAPGHGVLSDSDSEAFVSAGGNRHRQKRTGTGGLAAAAAASKRDRSQLRDSRAESVASPPVSVKVKMHNDGRHVTLRRLNEEEAAAEREARKRERQRRNGSVSSLGDTDRERWRRTEALEMAQAEAGAQESQQTIRPVPIPMPEGMVKPLMPGQLPGPPPGPPPGQVYGNVPPPPPIPGSAINVAGSGMSSPPDNGLYGTETDVSNYDSNRRRRRAERAQAKQARQGGRVEFS